ncbi:MAG: Fic family protein [Micrococcales bacterium]|nr:Fic family protein [Micrococcales bacterium]
MASVFTPPRLGAHDEAVIAEIDQMRLELSQVLRAPRRWQGSMRRSAQAKAIRGSNSIEGYVVSEGDAVAAVDQEAALTADERTWAEILGYRRMLTYVLNVGTGAGFTFDDGVVRSMHFMLLEHDLSKNPGNYRTGPIYVTREDGSVSYAGPDARLVPKLMAALVDQVNASKSPPMVTAALAHLNLVMIHPFRDGNGRMGRALQTLVLAMDHVLEPPFSSIEEWLGANTGDYYAVLAATGAGAWHPERSARLWTSFNLRAHHMQAQTVRRRFDEANRQWAVIDGLMLAHNLPARVGDVLFDAWLGFRVTRPRYVSHVEVDDRQASRDLARLSDLGLLVAHGQTKGRYYTAGIALAKAKDDLRTARQPLADPYPDLMAEARVIVAGSTDSSSDQRLF